MENQLQSFAKATCLIEAGRFKGTGFHFGAGWIMSVAHNFRNDDNDRVFQHSLLSETTFSFFSEGGRELKKFLAQPNRTAFIHHLRSGPGIDQRNKDIAMIKLGRQYARPGKEELTGWESEEEDNLTELNLTNFASMHKRVVKQDSKVHAIHYGGKNDDRKISESTVKGVTEPNDAISYGTIMLQPVLEDGASGCPIINESLQLVGMLVCCFVVMM